MIAWRLPLMAGVVFGGLVLLLTLRLIERSVFGLRRPFTPFVTQAVCRAVFPVMGIRLVRHGTPMRRRGAIVANHCSWLDIFALNALARVCFVSKSEVAGWPGIGWLARATGTVFITRNARDARQQKEVFEARLRAGHHLAFFPEGTSTDGRRVLDFKPTLFAAFFTHGLDAILSIQPVSLAYTAPPGEDPRFYGWWGAMDFGGHLLRVLAQAPQGRVEVTFHPQVPVAETADRKALARTCEAAVRAGLHAHLPPV
ncbi:lysophospholipid acyltransferase family protein [Pararhodobacter sp. SW119]|uniref:lysophospholipid acyltransferase family protein n=1 Tax=Pararhodobacter sp. SW119 TaxID=2780075 RepID=UPI001ADF5795|nr:lysophospholipid acyltransferase family protein [Pararhodobacter sp. SW119]